MLRELASWEVEKGWRFDFDGSDDPGELIEDMKISLNRLSATWRLSDTWPIHLRLEPDPRFHRS
jgi:hypothetical protein